MKGLSPCRHCGKEVRDNDTQFVLEHFLSYETLRMIEAISHFDCDAAWRERVGLPPYAKRGDL